MLVLLLGSQTEVGGGVYRDPHGQAHSGCQEKGVLAAQGTWACLPTSPRGDLKGCGLGGFPGRQSRPLG